MKTGFWCTEGEMAECAEPVWEPLEKAVGRRLAAGFMLMYDVRLETGPTIHAYKHIHTRCYLFLSDDLRAFQWTPCRRYAPQRLDFAIEAALCNWWLLAGWEPEDATAIRDAVLQAQARTRP